MDMLSRRAIVQPFASTHGLPCSGEGACGAKGHKDVDRGQGRDGTAWSNATGYDELEGVLDEILEETVWFGDAGGDGDAD